MTAAIQDQINKYNSNDDGEVLIKVDQVGKRFCRDLKRSLLYGVQDVFNDLRGKSLDESKLRKDEFWANSDISFELRRGECLGLLGGNGAGKTTLLKMLNGLIRPDKGRIQINGRVGALIALGAGFNPILTGKENVFIAGAVLGLSKKEIDKKYDEIVDFAELENFMNSPVQSYSSGMQVRLGFAVATALDPDILLVDEVLAVGDFKFRQKCESRIEQILNKAAVVFVSHNEGQVRKICNKALFLKSGKMIESGNLDICFSKYNMDGANRLNAEFYISQSLKSVDLSLKTKSLVFRQKWEATIYLTSLVKMDTVSIRVCFLDKTGKCLAEWNSLNYNLLYTVREGSNPIKIEINTIPLKPDIYPIFIEIRELKKIVYSCKNEHFLEISEFEGSEQMIYPVQL